METNDIKINFKKRKKKQLFVGILILPAIFFIVFLDESNMDKNIIGGIANLYLLIGSGILLAIGLVFSFLNWRCPSCNKYLGKKFSPEFCSSCGIQLQ